MVDGGLPAATARTFRLPAIDWNRLKAASRTGIASVAATVLISVFQLPFGAWALLTVMIMTLPTIGASVSKGIMRVVGTIVGGLLGIAILPLVQDPVPFCALLFATVAVAAYFGSGEAYPYAFVMGGLTAVIVATLGLFSFEHAVADAFDRMGEVTLGVAISVLVNVGIWPTRAQRELPKSVAASLRKCRSLLTASAARLAQSPAAAPQAAAADLHAAFRSQGQLLAQACYESRFFAARRRRYLRLLLEIDQLSAVLDSVCRRMPRVRFAAEMPGELRELCAVVDRYLGLLAGAIESFAPCTDPTPDLDRALASVEVRYESLRQAGRSHSYSLDELGQFDALLLGLREIRDMLAEATLTSCLLAEKAAPDGAGGGAGSGAPQPSADVVATPSPRFSLDQRRARFAIKAAVATLLTLLLWNLLQWPGGIEAVISAYIVTQASVGGANRKVLLRLVGAVSGGVLAFLTIAFAVPQIETLPPFAALVFFVTAGCAWVMLGSERVAYAGLQAGMAFLLTLFPEALQPTSITPATTRFVSVVFASLVTAFVLRTLWPVHAGRDLRLRVAGILREAAAMIGNAVPALRGQEGDLTALRTRARNRAADTSSLVSLAGEAALESRDQGFARDESIALLSGTEKILVALDAVGHDLETGIAPALLEQVATEVGRLAEDLQTTLREMAASLEGGARRTRSIDLRSDALALDRNLEAMRGTSFLISSPVASRSAFLALAQHLRELYRSVERVDRFVAGRESL